MPVPSDKESEFIEAACVPLQGGHATGDVEEAENLLREFPGIATASIYTAAILGDEASVRKHLSADRSSVKGKGGPRNWDALTYLCFSKYLRLDRSRSDGFVRAAAALLDGGVSANTGWYNVAHQPHREWESVLYGAAGIAHNEALTRLLLERGADPNDGEVIYHTPEEYDNGALKALVESGKMTSDSLATMLLRKVDWHDYDGIKWLLEHGADPNAHTRWGKTALHNAALSDNAVEIFEVLLDYRGDPTIIGSHPEVFRSAAGKSTVALAAWRGRGDVLGLFRRRGVPIELDELDRLIAACAENDSQTVRTLTAQKPSLVEKVLANGGRLLVEFAGNGNTDGVRQLLDLGVPVEAVHEKGDAYFGVAPNSRALHAASWRARHPTVRFLIERGAKVNELDGQGRSSLALAVLACVDSYWTERRSPESVEALLRAGALVSGVRYPCGYAEVDELLRAHGARE